MPRVGKAANKLFTTFKDHFNKVLHKTVTEVPLKEIDHGDRRLLQFSKGFTPICVPIGRGDYYLFVGQTMALAEDRREQRIRTLAYEYRLTGGPNFSDDPCLLRWEYKASDLVPKGFPRHHLQIKASINDVEPELDLSKLHIPSGWITIEELMRFLITELKITPRDADWDRILREGEDKFRKWTGRRI